MKARVRESGPVTIIEVTGKLMGGADADIFRDLIHGIIEEGKRKVLIDLSGVKWVNSTGVGILITGYTTLRRNNGDMKLLNVSNKIQSILYVTKLNLIFECYDDEDEAITSFS
ncbi:MAG: STAS domain-containing protein [Candidatus Krumholzibacteriota bacterium]|nr:STAS domain-containing protein [Candidatus Krumholzibacteriota bacterium]